MNMSNDSSTFFGTKHIVLFVRKIGKSYHVVRKIKVSKRAKFVGPKGNLFPFDISSPIYVRKNRYV